MVVTVVVLLAGLCWWMWPRVDQRFVGTWEVPKGWLQPNASVYEFHANGWGRQIEQPSGLPLDDTPAIEMAFRWWVEDDHLVLEMNNLSGLESLHAQAQTAIAPSFGLSPQLLRERRRVHNISGDSLTMDVQTNYRGLFVAVGTLQPTTLRRVRE